MKETTLTLKEDIIDEVCESFKNILQTLFILRKWNYNIKEKDIESTLRFYLNDHEESSKEKIELLDEKEQADINCDEMVKRLVRSISSKVEIRERSRQEIIKLFRSPEIFRETISGSGKKSEAKGTLRSSKGLKTAAASVVARSVKNSEDPVNAFKGNEGKGGVPRIGPRTRVFSSSLTKEQFKKNISYWADHEDELYRG